jgi:hypothetical protein
MAVDEEGSGGGDLVVDPETGELIPRDELLMREAVRKKQRDDALMQSPLARITPGTTQVQERPSEIFREAVTPRAPAPTPEPYIYEEPPRDYEGEAFFTPAPPEEVSYAYDTEGEPFFQPDDEPPSRADLGMEPFTPAPPDDVLAPLPESPTPAPPEDFILDAEARERTPAPDRLAMEDLRDAEREAERLREQEAAQARLEAADLAFFADSPLTDEERRRRAQFVPDVALAPEQVEDWRDRILLNSLTAPPYIYPRTAPTGVGLNQDSNVPAPAVQAEIDENRWREEQRRREREQSGSMRWLAGTGGPAETTFFGPVTPEEQARRGQFIGQIPQPPGAPPPAIVQGEEAAQFGAEPFREGTLTLDRLAALPPIEDFGQFTSPIIPFLNEQAAAAREGQQYRDRAEEVGRPDLAAIVQRNLDEANREFEQTQRRIQAEAAVAQAQAGRIVDGLRVDVGGGMTVDLRGRVVAGEFVPEETRLDGRVLEQGAMRMTLDEQQTVIDQLAGQGITVDRVRQPQDIGLVQAAATNLLGGAFKVAGAVNDKLDVIPVVGKNFAGGETLVEGAINAIGMPGEWGHTEFMHLTLRLPDAVLPEEDRELKAAMLSLPKNEREKLRPAWDGTLGNPEAKRDLARDIREGKTATDLNQEHSSFVNSLIVGFTTDPLNALNAVGGFVKGLAGLQSTRTLAGIQAAQEAKAINRALAHVSDAQAVAPWDDAAKGGLLGTKLLAHTPSGGIDIYGTVLGNTSKSARASTARVTGMEAVNVLEDWFNPASGRDVTQMEQFIRALATEGADAASPRFIGQAPTAGIQTTSKLAPDLVSAMDDAKTPLAQAFAKPVFEGDASAWAVASDATKKAMYANENEKAADVLGEIFEAGTKITRSKLGLGEADAAAVRLQGAMRGALSNLYLLNPRYYLRNALGDSATAFQYGTSAVTRPGHVRELERQLGIIYHGETVAGEVGAAGTGIIPGIKQFRHKLAGLERDRKRTITAFSANRGFIARRGAAAEVGIDALPAHLRPYVLSQGKSARTVADLEKLVPGGGNRAGVSLNARHILDDLFDGTQMPALEKRLDGIVAKAARGEDVTADVNKMVEEAVNHARTGNAHFGEVQFSDADIRAVQRRAAFLEQEGSTSHQAFSQALGEFAEDHTTNIRIAGKIQELEERGRGQFGPELTRELEGIQARRADVLKQTGTTWAERRANDEQHIRALDNLLVKYRTAQNGVAMGGPNGVKGFKTTDDLVKAAEERLRLADQKVRAADVIRVREANAPSVADEQRRLANLGSRQRARPEDVARLRAAEERAARPPGPTFADADAVIARAERRRAREGLEQARQQAADPKDITAAVNGLKGNGAAGGLGDVNAATAGAAVATENAKAALLALTLQARLPAAIADFATVKPALGALSPQEMTALKSYVATQKNLLGKDIAAARTMGRSIADAALHNYERTYDYDYLLRWFAPWELWTSRTLAKTPLRMADHPAYYSKFAVLRDTIRDTNTDLPDYLRDRVRVPMPFLPDWLGDEAYFDPVKLFLPTDLMQNYVSEAEQDTKIGTAKQIVGMAGFAPSPIVDTLLAMVPGGKKWYDAAIGPSSPISSLWVAGANIARLTGADVPIRPAATDKQFTEAQRLLHVTAVEQDWERDRFIAAMDDLGKHFTERGVLEGRGLTNEDAQRALDRAMQTEGIKSWLSLFGVLGAGFRSEEDQKRRGLIDQYFKVRDSEGKAAASAFIKANPDLKTYFVGGQTNAAVGRDVATAKYYDGLDRINKEYRAAIEALPLNGADIDRRQLFDAKERQGRELGQQLTEEYAGWTVPTSKARDLPHGIADALFDLPMVRDSNGVKDFPAFMAQKESYLKALERAPVTADDTILMEYGTRNLRPDVEKAMRATTPDGAAKNVTQLMLSVAYEARDKAGEGAKFREEKQRAEAAFEKNWKMPETTALADRMATDYPELFGPGGKYTMQDAFKALETGVVQTLQQAGDLSEQGKLQAFRAGLDERGVSSEPFYANKKVGALVKTQADLDRYLKAERDAEEFTSRKAANDPTYRLFDTAERAWLFGGPAAVPLLRLEQALYDQALGPLQPSGVRDGTKQKGFKSNVTLPDGRKMTVDAALKEVNAKQEMMYALQHQGEKQLPSEKKDEAKAQTAGSNTTARSGTPRTSTSRPRTTTSGTRSGTGSTRAAADAGPRAPAVNWINDAALSKRELVKPETNLREEYRKGLGLTPEKFEKLVNAYPDVQAAFGRIEAIHRGIFAEGADQNAVTAAVQEEALRVQEILAKAKATEAERRAGPIAPRVSHIDDAWLQAKRIRAGATDFERGFRLGTQGLSDPGKWAEFTANHPEVRAALDALSERTAALKTDDDAPDDAAALDGLYTAVSGVSDLISAALTADREAKDELRTAGLKLREEQKAIARERLAGPPKPNAPNINEAWLDPKRLRAGVTDFDRAYRLGSGMGTQEWGKFLQANPGVRQQIQALQQQARGVKDTKSDVPMDMEQLQAIFEAAQEVGVSISEAKNRAKEEKAEAARSRVSYAYDSDEEDARLPVHLLPARKNAKKKRTRRRAA